EHPLHQSDVYFQFCDKGNKPTTTIASPHSHLQTFPMPFSDYKIMFDKVMEACKKGEVKVVNLTVKTPIQANMSDMDIFLLSNSMYQLYLPERFVCFSPERFVRIANGRISSNPMKGTIDASLPNAEREVLDNPKELAEHTATVQLIADELMTVATNVRTERFRYIDRLETNNKCLLQVSSEVVGELPSTYISHLGDTLFKLLPAGSIAGSPRLAALKLISRAEETPRGYYCGIAGYFDGTELDTAVLIRLIERDGDQIYFRSGGGITMDSICENEYQEVQNKIYLPFL
ncbi:MAG: aminodeoxychorismate synthase component I, partial [Rikenellaceae bacterium]